MLLSAGDVLAVELINPHALHPVLITGDHAGNAVPEALANLGLPAGELARHIAWDIGIADLARLLAARLNATAVLARYSRLVIDANRALGEAGLIVEASDGTPVPANLALTDNARAQRITELYWPYHQTIDSQIARLQRRGLIPIVLALHSFTPALKVGTAPRPWHVGVLYGPDLRLANLLLTALKKEGLTVGANEPYSGVTHGFGLKVHGVAHGIPHAELEIRQDLITSAEGREVWADRLARVMQSVLSSPELKTLQHH